MIRGLHAVLPTAWHSGNVSPDWIKGLVIPIRKGKGNHQDCNIIHNVTLLSLPGKVLAHSLLKHQKPEQFGYTLGKSYNGTTCALGTLESPLAHKFP